MTRSWEAIWESSSASEEISRATAVARGNPDASSCAADKVRQAGTVPDQHTREALSSGMLADSDGVLLISKQVLHTGRSHHATPKDKDADVRHDINMLKLIHCQAVNEISM